MRASRFQQLQALLTLGFRTLSTPLKGPSVSGLFQSYEFKSIFAVQEYPIKYHLYELSFPILSFSSVSKINVAGMLHMNPMGVPGRGFCASGRI